jgi:hypothetical protein
MDMDFPPLADLAQQDFAPDFFGGIMPSPEMLKASLVSALAGGGGILAVTNGVEWLGRWITKQSVKEDGTVNETVAALGGSNAKAAYTVLIGILAGNAVYMSKGGTDAMRQQTGLAITSAVAGLGMAKLVANGITKFSPEDEETGRPMFEPRSSLSAAEVARVPDDQFFSATRGPVGEGFNQVMVEDDAPLSLGSPEVETDELQLAAAWLG